MHTRSQASKKDNPSIPHPDPDPPEKNPDPPEKGPDPPEKGPDLPEKDPDPTPELQERVLDTKDEFDVWMREARSLLLEYLEFCREKAQAQPTADALSKTNKTLDDEWRTNWVSHTDVQTGEIYDEDERDKMISAMAVSMKELSELHGTNKTTRWHVRYQVAQNYWDDFLYYQNQWNRRDEYFAKLSKREKKKIKTWARFLIDNYNKYEIGARSEELEALDADQLHQYPEGPWSRSSRPTLDRTQHLQKKFSESAVRINQKSVEKRRDEVNVWRQKQEGFDAGRLPDSQPTLKPYSAATARQWGKISGMQQETSWESQDDDAVANVQRITPPASIDVRPRYVTKQVMSLVRTFVWKEVKGVPAEEEVEGTKQFLGDYVDKVRHERHFVLDHNGQRIREDPNAHPAELPGRVEYRILASSSGLNNVQGPGRRDRARRRVSAGISKDWRKNGAVADDDREAEFSDDDNSRAVDNDPEVPEIESEDEQDLFTLSYKGSPLPKPKPRNRNPKSGEDSSDESDSNEPDDGPKKPSAANGTRVSHHQPQAPGETFEAIPGEDDWDLATYTYRFSDETTFTQRTRVPAFKIDVEPAKGGTPLMKVYPEEAVIGANSSRTTPWKSNPEYAPREDNKFEGINGRWENGKDHWDPTVIARTFRKDNNGYYRYHIISSFEAVMKGDERNKQVLQEPYIQAYDKASQQIYRRHDEKTRTKLKAKSFGPWTDGEENILREYARSNIQKDGLIKWQEDWLSTHINELCRRLTAHRREYGKDEQGQKERSRDSMTSKFKRFYEDLDKQAKDLKAEIDAGKTPSEDQLKPKDILFPTTTKKDKPPTKESKTKPSEAEAETPTEAPLPSSTETIESTSAATGSPSASTGVERTGPDEVDAEKKSNSDTSQTP